MKNKYILSTVLGCGLLALGQTAVAQSSNSVHNVEKFNAKFNLAPTADAPEGARGKAEIKSIVTDGTQSGTVSVETRGLDAGEYILNGVHLSGGGTVELGTITVGDTNNPTDHKLKSKDKFDLPADLDAGDITQVNVANGGGTVLLMGDLADPENKSKATLNAVVPIIAGPGAPDATGKATLKSSIRKGERKDRFTLIASGLPASTTFNVDVDGADGGTVTSNKKGKVLVKDLPDGLTELHTVRLVDDGGIEALRAEF